MTTEAENCLEAAEYNPLEDADLLEEIVRALVADPRSVKVDERRDQRGTHILHVDVAPEDVGKIIGKQGRMASALRTVMHAIGTLNGYSLMMEIEDKSDKPKVQKVKRIPGPRKSFST